jgi:hypothetical protein
MIERTDLHVVPAHQPVCTVCGLGVAQDLGEPICRRCRLYRQLDLVLDRWPTEAREHVLATVHHAVQLLPPEDVGEFFALLAQIATVDH